MFDYVNLGLFQALNLLYVVPILAVIFCVIIVYAFGFKSPVPPPSFEGIEEEKKFTKKKRSKDQKAKSLQNGKLNGSAVNKAQTNASAGKKKDVEKGHEKSAGQSKKATTNTEKTEPPKRVRLNSAKSQHKDNLEKKRDIVAQDDANDDGWVQLVSKKERKHRKKEDTVHVTEPNVKTSSPPSKKTESSAPVIIHADELPRSKSDSGNKIETKSPEKITLKKIKDEADIGLEKISVTEVKNDVVSDDVVNNDLNFMEQNNEDEKDIEPTLSGKSDDVINNVEEAKTKSKKKKKKNANNTSPQNISDLVASEPPTVQDIPYKKQLPDDTITSIVEITDENKPNEEPSSDSKNSNVAFDELAGMYPVKKEQKKKKKVRRDH